jgi:cytochrome c oxidase cbb3-type subunit 3
MRVKDGLVAAAFLTLGLAVAQASARATPQTPSPPGPGAAGAQGGRGRGATFPAQQRPPGDPALIDRGKTFYGVNCTSCHGADLRGGDMGGPNLLRSQVVLNDQHGELILPIVRGSRADKGMPPLPLNDADVTAIAEFIHSVAATMRGQGSPPAGPPVELNVLVGDATAGQAYFAAKCSSCHSATGDLKGIASRVPDPKTLQNLWVSGGGGGGRGGRGGGDSGESVKPRTVTVTMPVGQKIEGRLDRLDDFYVLLTQADGVSRTIRRDGDVPKVEIHDPYEPHRKLLPVYTDKDIHDVTAFLVTLK